MTFTDRESGGLHAAGLAEEFTVHGSSAIKHYEGALPVNGPLDPPPHP